MDSELRERCRRSVRHMLGSREWKLVSDESDLAEEVEAEVEARLPYLRTQSLATVIEYAIIKRYGYRWHAACHANGTLRQRRAFEELDTLLYRAALKHLDGDENLAQDCVQSTLENVWKNLDRINDPGSFMWWVLKILRNQAYHLRTRDKHKRIDPLTGQDTWDENLLQENGDAEHEGGTSPGTAKLNGTPTDQAQTMNEDIRAKLEASIRQCLNNKNHQEVIIKTFLDDKSRVEVSEELQISPEVVSVLKNRAIKHLQECKDFLTLLEELL